MKFRIAVRRVTLWARGLSLALFLLLIGEALFPGSSARACSQSYWPTELRPGTAFFSDEGLWVMSVERSWVLLSPDGRVRRAPQTGASSRILAGGRSVVLLNSGTLTSECSMGWVSLSRLDLETGARIGSARLRRGWEYGPSTIAPSPSGRQVLLMGSSGAAFLAFPRRVFSPTIPLTGTPVWLDEGTVAVYGNGRLSLLQPNGEVTPLMRVQLERLLPEQASPDHVMAVERVGESRSWRLLEIDLTSSPPTLSRAPWVGHGVLLGLSGSSDRLVVLRDGEVRVLDRRSGELLAVVRSEQTLVEASLSHDGARLSVSSRRLPLPAPGDLQHGEDFILWERGQGALTLEVFSLEDGSRLQSWGGTGRAVLELLEPEGTP